MRVNFVKRTFRHLFSQNVIAPTDSLIDIGGTDTDAAMLRGVGFDRISVININKVALPEHGHAVNFIVADFTEAKLGPNAFDIAFTSDCLHHCSAPHAALLAMYRVARKAVIVIESRDNALMRLAGRVGLAQIYELQKKNLEGKGGVDFTAVPNFVYRWTESEFEKTIRSYDPTIQHEFFYRYEMSVPEGRLRKSRNPVVRSAGLAMRPMAKAMHMIVPRQCNTFAMIAVKDPERCALWPWLERRGEEIVPAERYYAQRRFHN